MPFQKGQSGNPSGKCKGIKQFSMARFMDACRKVEKKEGKPLYVHFVEQMYKDNKVLVAGMRKLLPDMVKMEGEIDISTNVRNMLPEHKEALDLAGKAYVEAMHGKK